MVRVRGSKIIVLILAVILVFTCLYIPVSAVDYPVGLNVSKTILTRGEDITVVIASPLSLEDNADTIDLKFYYDPAMFYVKDSDKNNWSVQIGDETTLPAGTYCEGEYGTENGKGVFTLVVSNGTLNLDDRSNALPVKGKQFKCFVPLTVKSNAKVTESDITFSKNDHSISYTTYADGSGFGHHEMWGPDKDDTVHVTLTGLPSVDDPITTGGISLRDPSVTTFDRGGQVKLKIDIPTVAWELDSRDIIVNYDPTLFTLDPTWVPETGTRLTTGLSAGQFGVRFTDAQLDNPITLYPILKVNSNAKNTGSTDITLDSQIKKDGSRIWAPVNDTVTVGISGLPVTGGGIAVSPSSVELGKTKSLYVTVNVPKTDEPAESGRINVTFDPTAFKVESVSSVLDIASFDNVAGTITLEANGAINLKNGYTLTALVTPKEDADPAKPYAFTLDTHSFLREGDHREIWRPETTSAPVNVFATTGKGSFTASKTSLNPGDEFTVTLTLPALTTKADNVNLVVSYNPLMFEAEPFYSGLIGVNDISQEGKFGITGTNLDLSSEIRLTAKMKVKYTAKKGNQTFTLSGNKLEYKKSDGTYSSLWTPPANVTVNILKDSTDFPVKSDGLSVSSSRVRPDGTFTATIKVPSMYATGELFSADVYFDSSVFSVQSVTSSNPSAIKTDYASGYFCADSKVASFDLSKGLTITANMKVNSYAVTGKTYDLQLTNTELTGIIGTGAPSQSLWEPDPHKTVASVTVPSLEDDFPVTGGGISFSPSSVYPGEQFTLYVKLPPIDISVDNASFTVDFDGNVFDIISWDPRLSGSIPTSGTGYISLNASGFSVSDLSKGMSFYATLRAKTGISAGRYQFRLTRASVTSSKVGKELWTPSTTYADLTILGNSQYNPYYDPYCYPWKPSNTCPDTRPSPNKDKDIIHYDPDDDDDSSSNPKPSNNTKDNTSLGNSGKSSIRIELNGDIRYVANSGIKANTKKSFFGGDTLIIIRNTDLADRSAAAALKNLAMSGCRNYAFDVSVYDYSTGSYIHNMPNGYIDISIPVPNVFTGSPERIAVYHVENGNPEYIPSEVVYENGMKKIKYRATSFSPYMFVDPASTGGNTSNGSGGGNYTVNTGNGTDNGYSAYIDDDDYYTVPNNVRPANPSTGKTAALIIIPAATLGCVLLAKRGKKRKRSGRR